MWLCSVWCYFQLFHCSFSSFFSQLFDQPAMPAMVDGNCSLFVSMLVSISNQNKITTFVHLSHLNDTDICNDNHGEGKLNWKLKC